MKKIIAMAITICILLSGCIEKKQSFNQSVINKEYITYAMTKMPKNLNMRAIYDDNSLEMLNSIFEGLVKKDDEGNIIPAIAERWEVSKDKTTYKFYIRNDVCFSNGEPITAESFKMFFSELLNKDTDNPFAYQLFCIFGAEAYKNGKVDFDNVAISSIEDNILQIKLNNPCSFFIELLANPLYGLRELDNKINNWEINYSTLKYSGKYIIKDVNSDGINLVPNEKYWGIAASNKIKMVKVENDEEALANLQLGKVDLFKSEHLNNIGNILEDPLRNEGYKFQYLVFNVKENRVPYKVRKVIKQVLNREKIYKELLKDETTSINGFMNLREEKVKNDTKNNQSNIELGSKPTLKFIYKDTAEDKKVASYLKADIEKKSNITIELNECSESDFIKYISNGEYDMTLMKYDKEYDNAMSIFEKFTYNNPFNYSKYNNSLYNGYVNLLKTNKDAKKQSELQNKCFEILEEDIPVIPLYSNNIYVYKNKYIEGLKLNYKSYIIFEQLLIDKSII